MRKSAIFKALVIGASLIIPVERVEAQVSYDQVTATVTDPDGHLLANAPFSWVLVDSLGNRVSSATTPNGQIYNAAPVRGNLSNAGVMSVQLVPNGILTKPSGTRWQLSITPPLPVDQSNILTYQPPWNLTYTTTISAPVDLSTQISAQTSIVNYFNTQTGQSTLTGWLVGTSDPPSLPCNAGLHAGYLYMASDNAAFQCNNAVGGVYQWNLFVGSSTAGVSKIIPGANVTCSPNVSGSCQGDVTLNATASSTTVNVNGSPVSDPNFNGSTPAAGSNGKNVAFQVSGSNVSGEVVGDGNAAHYLDGTGSYSTPAGTGTLTSIQSQTGPAITLQSTGGTVTITTPTSDHINLEAAASASGVQYNPTSTQYIFTGDSENVDDDHVKGGTLITVTNVNCNGTVCIFTNSGTNGFAAGDWVFTDLITSPGFFSCSTSITGVCNLFQVLSAGLSTTQFEIAYTANTGTGTGGQVENANYFLPFLTCNQPFFKNHGACFVSIPVGATLVSLDTNFATAITAYATGTPTYLLINGGKNDIQNCDSAATIEGHFQSIWAKAHTAGMTVIQGTITPSRWNTAISLGCPTAFTTLQEVNAWMTTQRKTAANAAAGQYIDRLVNMQAILNDMNSTFWFQSGPSLGSLSDKGTAQQALLINEEMSTQGDAQRSYPQQIIPSPFGGGLAPTADGYAWVPPFVDSSHAFEVRNHAGTQLLIQFDTSALTVKLPQLPSRSCLGTDSSGTLQTGTCGTTTNALTFNNSGSGDASGSNFNGNAAKTLSYNSIGAAPLVSPTFTGTPAAPTAALGTNTTQLATTAFVLANAGSTYTGTSPIVVSGTVISCPTCGTGSGGTSVSQNSGSAETNLPITGYMPQVCSDTSGSGTAQSCTVANTFVPQAGNCIVYKTTTANSGTGLTVNVNSLGAKSVAVAGSSGWTTTLTGTLSIPANKPLNLCYDGTNWNASGTGYLPSGAFPSAPIPVQSVFVHANTGGQTLTLGSTPTVGNVLIMYTVGSSSMGTTATGFTQFFQCAGGGGGGCGNANQGVWMAYRVVQAGDGTAWVSNTDVNAQVTGLFEMSGVQSFIGSSAVPTSTASSILTCLANTRRGAYAIAVGEMDNLNNPISVSNGTALFLTTSGTFNHSSAWFTPTGTSFGATVAVTMTSATMNTPICPVLQLLSY